MTAVLLVTEQSPAVGLGHLTRSLTLAAAIGGAGAVARVLTFGLRPLRPPLPEGVDVVFEGEAHVDAMRTDRIRRLVDGEGTRRVTDEALR